MNGGSVSILLVDDDPTIREVGAYNLRKSGLVVDVAENGADALARFDPTRHQLVITDLSMPEVDGMELMVALHKRVPGLPVVMVTAHGSVDRAVAAMQAGAWSFIEKPFARDQLTLVAARALETARLRADNKRLRSVERPILGSSVEMRRTLDLVDRVAASSASVLVIGESGTGKELVARRIHARSPRSDRPFVAVNCAAIPGDLLEAELFGHAKGAFTGAISARPGRFRSADGGTLFLDELGEMPLAVQGKLLRVLQEGQVDVVGSDNPVSVDVRVVAATNQDLDAMVLAKVFRSDLLFRLDVVRVEVPALRERSDDIPFLVQSFLEELSPRVLAFSDAAMAVLKGRLWPGNVRELRNLVERVSILAPGPIIEPQDLSSGARPQQSSAWLDQLPEGISLVDVEAQLIVHVLGKESWNVSQAARRLGVPRHILAYRIQKYGIELP
ncbi:MAG: DNA-binding NtrC family response regulator [Cognaticolwellia sp.]|jgi:DNA-binding NtrC family response regulator